MNKIIEDLDRHITNSMQMLYSSGGSSRDLQDCVNLFHKHSFTIIRQLASFLDNEDLKKDYFEYLKDVLTRNVDAIQKETTNRESEKI